MIDVRRLRTEADQVRAALARRHIDLEPVDRVIELDRRLRELAGERDGVRSRVRVLSKEVGQARRTGDDATVTVLSAESRALGEREGVLDVEVAAVEGELRELLLRIPNLPSPLAPDGASDADNPVLRVVGYDPDPGAYAEHQRVPHWDTGLALGILDNERATKIAGSMFTMLRGPGATMGRALCQLALDRNADAFEEIRPPSLVSTETLTATGQLPKFADDAYAVERDDLWAIPTAEVPLTSIARDEVLDEAELPMRLMAYSSCYRREAGSAGRDTRGLLRTHEFDKVEILAYATPEQAPALLDELVARVEGLVADLGLAYRVIEICTGDLGQSHHRSFDIEVYAPGCDRWLEVSSVSWFSDYQARRANIRYRPTEGKGNEMVHTLNGSALAVPHVWAAIVETYRQPDGSVAIPEVLHPYMRGAVSIQPKALGRQLMRALPWVVAEPPDRPQVGGPDHPMRVLTREAAFDPGSWNPARAASVAATFDGLAAEWDSRFEQREMALPLQDCLARGGPFGPRWVEVGAGTGRGTLEVAAPARRLVALDLAGEMLRRLDPALAAGVQADSAALPLRAGCADVLLAVNAFLFPAEVDRVLATGGALVWVNTLAEWTPIHLPPDDVAAALPGPWGRGVGIRRVGNVGGAPQDRPVTSEPQDPGVSTVTLTAVRGCVEQGGTVATRRARRHRGSGRALTAIADAPPTAPAIRLVDVAKRFPGSPAPAVTSLSLDVPVGGLMALVGPSGCGKTTTLKMINRLIEPTSGTIEVGGADVSTLKTHELRRGIGYVIQQSGLFPHRTVAENIATVPRLLGWKKAQTQARNVRKLADLVGLTADQLDRYPAELSGGQQQRVGVARALAIDPPILLMDEPYSALDPIVRARLQDELLILQERLHKTIVLVTHDIDEAIKLADQVAVLNVGGVLEQCAAPEELLRAPASPFVESFLGRERGLKRLSLHTVGEVALSRGPVVATTATPEEAKEAMVVHSTPWVGVLDDEGRLLGWVWGDQLDGSDTVGDAPRERFRAHVGLGTTLREALDGIVNSRTGVAVVLDGDRYLGMLRLEQLSEGIQ